MSLPQRDISPLAGQLEQTLSAGRLPSEVSGWGSQLLQRLRQPVQVAVAGSPGSGKSALIDMLLGRVVIGRNGGGLLVDICHGAQEMAEVETAAGEHLQIPGLLAQMELPQDARRVRQILPDPRLRWHSYRELPLAGPLAAQQEMLQQAAASADIILWCSQEFAAEEQALWAAVPDSTKDHSFLVLTMADRQVMRGTLPALIETLEPVAAEEFLGVYPVAAIQGLTARAAEAPQDGLWRSSGGKQLAEDVQRQVDLGRASDVDQAELLIRQFGGTLPAEAAAAAAAAPATAPATVPATVPVSAIASAPQAASLAAALDQLQSGAEAMLAEAEAAGGPQAAPVLAQCMEMIRNLSQSLDEMPASAAVEAAREAAQDGEEMLMLCQLEQDEDAAVDAVTLLIQLKKELMEEPPG
ncbi:zeta toxin family protein (plasmid) [Leisingera sp. S132]|uniref:zeta toxin family protein n=1 Tax=Leisingera sp. S132 TaxID=2867016 RepID=UPI0021A65E02|nr:zeta toxin family protein [Leisingera sp. S132]UWQ81727.1 zeta toxin family protein [Leisingera sp. S132]